MPSRTDFSANYLLKHGAYEKWAYRKYYAALKEQVQPVIAHVKLYGNITPALSDLLIRKTPMETAYSAVYVKIGTLSAKSTRDYINKGEQKSALSFFSAKWKQLMQLFFENESAGRVSDVTDTTRNKVRKVLADSEGMPVSMRATYITTTLNDPDFNRSRALVIARTESTTAANKGAELGNADSDYLTQKSWLSISDRNTRATHMAADGESADENGNFVVGGYLCKYPGDISLPAEEVIQCRCSVLYTPLYDNFGLPILKGS